MDKDKEKDMDSNPKVEEEKDKDVNIKQPSSPSSPQLEDNPATKVAEDVKSFFRKFGTSPSLSVFKKQPTLRETLNLPPKRPSRDIDMPVKLMLSGGNTHLSAIEAHGFPSTIPGFFKWYKVDTSGLTVIPLVSEHQYCPSFLDIGYKICAQWHPLSESEGYTPSSFAEIAPIRGDPGLVHSAAQIIQEGAPIDILSASLKGTSLGSPITLGPANCLQIGPSKSVLRLSQSHSQSQTEEINDTVTVTNNNNISINIKVDGRPSNSCTLIIACEEGPLLVVCRSHAQRELVHVCLDRFVTEKEDISQSSGKVIVSIESTVEYKDREFMTVQLKETTSQLSESYKRIESLQTHHRQLLQELDRSKAEQGKLSLELSKLNILLSERTEFIEQKEKEKEKDVEESSEVSSETYKSTIVQLTEEIAHLQSQIETLQARILSLQSDMEDIETRHQSEGQENRLLKSELVQLQDQIQQLRLVRDKLAQESDSNLDKVHTLESTVIRLQKETEELGRVGISHQEVVGKLRVVRSDRERLKVELSSVEKEMGVLGLEGERMGRECLALKRRIEKVEGERDGLREEISVLKAIERERDRESIGNSNGNSIGNSISERERESKSESHNESERKSEREGKSEQEQESEHEKEEESEGNSISLQAQEQDTLVQCDNQPSITLLEDTITSLTSQLSQCKESYSLSIEKLSTEKNALRKKLQSLQKDMEHMLRSSRAGKGILDEHSVGTERYQVLVAQVHDLLEERSTTQKSLEMYKTAFEQQVGMAMSPTDSSTVARHNSELMVLSQRLSETLGERDIQVRSLKEICRVLQSKVSDYENIGNTNTND